LIYSTRRKKLLRAAVPTNRIGRKALPQSYEEAVMRSYKEIVTLVVPGDAPRTLSLADAVFATLHIENRVKRIGATILRDSGEQVGHGEMEEICRQPDFPKGRISN
jgi:hypothetical protein